MRLVVEPAVAPLTGRYTAPGDKSISHRLAILAGLADGDSVVSGYLDSADTRATLAAMASLGAVVTEDQGELRIRGGRLGPPDAALDLGNSGTGVRLLAGALAGHPQLFDHSVRLVGDESLSRRPMDRIIDPLRRMGGRIDDRDGCLPMVLSPAPLHAIRYRPPVASAQVKSAVLLAGLWADGETIVVEPGPSRDHTERLLPAFGVEVSRRGEEIGLVGGQTLRPGRFHVPGDLSSAAFAAAAGLMVPGSSIELDNVGLNPSRDGVLRILEAMHGRVDRHAGTAVGNEPVGSLGVRASRLQGVEIPPAWVPLAIDEFPVIMALAAVAEGRTIISGAAELRVKESDRLAVMCRQLARLGVAVHETADGAEIQGGRVRGGVVDSCGDHRIAMSLAVLGLVAEAPVRIENAEWIQTSYPGFVDDLSALGAVLRWEEEE
ncbi:MAG: 3-phosphoshikimate 1-carboxyvinyltransferase [Wenzhouxiangella sp.]|nr:MAG: 3-phosphoshikimate 1-carboxyvinyltransferase [Wenzhouxiangella sp.]